MCWWPLPHCNSDPVDDPKDEIRFVPLFLMAQNTCKCVLTLFRECVCVCVSVCVCVYLCVCVYMYLCVCMCVYVAEHVQVCAYPVP